MFLPYDFPSSPKFPLFPCFPLFSNLFHCSLEINVFFPSCPEPIHGCIRLSQSCTHYADSPSYLYFTLFTCITLPFPHLQPNAPYPTISNPTLDTHPAILYPVQKLLRAYVCQFKSSLELMFCYISRQLKINLVLSCITPILSNSPHSTSYTILSYFTASYYSHTSPTLSFIACTCTHCSVLPYPTIPCRTLPCTILSYYSLDILPFSTENRPT